MKSPVSGAYTAACYHGRADRHIVPVRLVNNSGVEDVIIRLPS